MTNAEWRSAPESPADHEDEAREPKHRRSWSLDHWAMRLAVSIGAGWIVNVVAGTTTLGTVIAVVLFVLITAIVTVGRRG